MNTRTREVEKKLENHDAEVFDKTAAHTKKGTEL